MVVADDIPNEVETLVIGAGQAGLSTGYHLGCSGEPFLIVHADARVGDSWRRRWDSLRLFTTARFSSLDGWPFPGSADRYPSKDEMAFYLESYARRFGLPIVGDFPIDRLAAAPRGFVAQSRDREISARNVVIAMHTDQRGRVPAFASDLDPGVRQLHSSQYQRPSQLDDGPVLVVGAATSGVEIALDLVRTHDVFLAGRHPPEMPFDVDSSIGRTVLMPFTLRVFVHRLATMRTPIGRRMRAKLQDHGKPLVRTKSADVERAGVVRLPRVVGARDGRPQLADGRTLDVGSVVWCTGYDAGLTWVDLEVFDEDGRPRHHSGIVDDCPGLYFVGLEFLHAVSSGMVHGVGRDARRVASAIAGTAPGRRAIASSHNDNTAVRTRSNPV
jgi:putative flavoprotein involved in K+ transport